MNQAFLLFASKTQSANLDQQVHTITLQAMKVFGLESYSSHAYLFQWGFRITLALVIFLLFLFLARKSKIRRTIEWIDDRIGVIELSNGDRNIFAFLLTTAFWLAGILLILFVLKLTALLTTVGLSAGTLTALTAFSNREFLGNVFAGLAIESRGQINPGDSIQVKKISGKLDSIGLTSSQIIDYNGVVHFIPNTKLLNEVLSNFSLAEYRRATINFWFDADAVHTEEFEEVAERILAEAPGQDPERKGYYRYGTYNEHGQEVNFYVYYKPDNWGENLSQTRRLLRDYIEQAEVQIGIPQTLMLQVEK